MAQLAKITGEESLEAWLKTQPLDVAEWIAVRAALRVFPYFREWLHTDNRTRERDLTALLEMRFYLTSAVSALRQLSISALG
jgi:hypothetical protein